MIVFLIECTYFSYYSPLFHFIYNNYKKNFGVNCMPAVAVYESD